MKNLASAFLVLTLVLLFSTPASARLFGRHRGHRGHHGVISIPRAGGCCGAVPVTATGGCASGSCSIR